MSKLAFPAVFLIILFLAGCGPADATPVPTALAPPPLEAYPAPTTVSMAPEAYPPPAATDHPGILVALDKPILAGDTFISGVGPADLPVLILNVTFLGEEIGAGVINEDGTFSIRVDPVPSGIRVGLTADAGTIGLTESDIKPGDDAISVPEVGYFYDSFVIMQP